MRMPIRIKVEGYANLDNEVELPGVLALGKWEVEETRAPIYPNQADVTSALDSHKVRMEIDPEVELERLVEEN